MSQSLRLARVLKQEAELARRLGLAPALADARPAEILEQAGPSALKAIPVVTLR